jgi:hypothetical protein
MAIEKEIRFYFSFEAAAEIAARLAREYKYLYSAHETTTMYDNPNPEFTFYSKAVDGRLRVRNCSIAKSKYFNARMSVPVDAGKCLITWKRRLPLDDRTDAIRREEEIEYQTMDADFSNVVAIFEKVLKCKRVSSYERIRSFLSAQNIQVTFDEFPYGVMLEFELTKGDDENALVSEIEKFGLSLSNASGLSCDDKYFELCELAGVTKQSDIKFNDKTMPVIK